MYLQKNSNTKRIASPENKKYSLNLYDSNKVSPRKVSKNKYNSFKLNNCVVVNRCSSPVKLCRKIQNNCCLSKNDTHDGEGGFQFERFCDQFNRLDVSEKDCDFIDWTCCVPEHDRKIISRLAMKRARLIAETQEAVIARERWEREKEDRERLIKEHEVQYNEYLQLKRKQDYKETWRKTQMNRKQQKYQQAQLKTKLKEKINKTNEILKDIEFQKDLEILERKEEAARRAEMAAVNLQSKQVQEKLRRCEILDNLQDKLLRAELRRSEYLQKYQHRIASANSLSESLHRSSLQAARYNQESRIQRLRDDIAHTDHKSSQVKQWKDKFVSHSRQQAQRTAELRENIRRSLSPDSIRQKNRNIKIWKPHMDMEVLKKILK